MWPRFGIKIGNSTLCIAHVKNDGKPEVIANKQGDRNSQACLLWGGDEEIECGLTAKQKMATRPKQAVANSFQLLMPQELDEERLKTAIKELPCDYDALSHTFQLKCQIQDDKSDEMKENIRELTPFDVQVKLFRAELELARQYHISSEKDPVVVISIPSFYPKSAWPELARAAKEAGFHVAQIITEPTAAILAYGIGEQEVAEGSTNNESKYVLTIKCGGLNSHFALYEVRDGLYTQLDAYGPYPIGGQHFTDALVQFICEEFKRKYKLDPHESRRSLSKIRNAATNCKHILTTLPSTQIYIDSLMDGVDFNAQMSRARFESLIQPVINNFMQTLNECVERASVEHPEVKGVNSIVLLGATMRIPKLQSVIAARFPDALLHSTISADEVVAIGCARQATFLHTPLEQDLQATDERIYVEEDLLIWHGNDETNAQILIGKGTSLPRKVLLELKQTEGAETDSVIRVRSGDKVNEVTLEGLTPTDNGTYRIEADIDCKQVGAEPIRKPHLRIRVV
ncbi:heat shock 70 kDa protein 14 [Bactrocera neohumeralis]|uniref:heat shock 70 kDa protein 14 n=1 Tax=Bactrocera tryoni TaxID=59916 RepID=UPI001A99F4CB|nr:heat shock 70 kDa protein 14 [Bactrocera tryoni]XP_050333098.1 heat shock 70 kDa protein 14 [Bactrocera neohumeralis]